MPNNAVKSTESKCQLVRRTRILTVSTSFAPSAGKNRPYFFFLDSSSFLSRVFPDSSPNSSKESTLSHQYQRSCSLSEHRCGFPVGRFASKQAQTRCLLSLESPQDASTPTKELLSQKVPPSKTTEADVHGGVSGAPLSLMQVIDEAKQSFHPIRTNEKGSNALETDLEVDLVLPSRTGHPSSKSRFYI